MDHVPARRSDRRRGPFYDAKDSTLAITDGTGRYSDTRGTLDLQSRAGGSEFAFVFHVIG